MRGDVATRVRGVGRELACVAFVEVVREDARAVGAAPEQIDLGAVDRGLCR